MNRIHTRIRRLACALAALASALVASVSATPAAFATTSPGPVGPAPADARPGTPVKLPPLPAGWYKHPSLPAHTHAVAAGSTPGWQITLNAAGAVLLAAALAVTIYRSRAMRRRVTAAAA
jgi:hypothetical protein